jgi:hypothetical protein
MTAMILALRSCGWVCVWANVWVSSRPAAVLSVRCALLGVRVGERVGFVAAGGGLKCALCALMQAHLGELAYGDKGCEFHRLYNLVFGAEVSAFM